MTKQVSICLLALLAAVISSSDALTCFNGIDTGTIGTNTCDIGNGFCFKREQWTSANPSAKTYTRTCVTACDEYTTSTVASGVTTYDNGYCCSLTDKCNAAFSVSHQQSSAVAAVLLVAGRLLF